MAIQLSDRDMTIFKYIEEHHVLLEKHIAWFISCDDKPVLIRDRLRKLFYLDYLLCQRHGGKLPWWTTPTKPLVYMLSPMARAMVRSEESDVDLANDELQRHLLELANLRMLLLMDQKSGLISDVEWSTVKQEDSNANPVGAVISFRRNGRIYRAGLVNHPLGGVDTIVQSAEPLVAAGAIESLWIVSRDESHQEQLQRAMSATGLSSRSAFATHQEVYKSGIIKCRWQGVTRQFAPVTGDAILDSGPQAPGGQMSFQPATA